jgi:hypothetical protein
VSGSTSTSIDFPLTTRTIISFSPAAQSNRAAFSNHTETEGFIQAVAPIRRVVGSFDRMWGRRELPLPLFYPRHLQAIARL